ncbi:MAG: type II toxin-antitoxin system RelE/ParE family toxin [Firmicutes bacterium]|jgi:plasmid stabilization system protein ParE|nr:type II toxin-antitoxin system RelE/ParE family toxin [Dethiobacter sp.]MBS3897501.1 type II toxin-antitoxin system RelE/ParE family toxin [Dethiobacter sp.]MCL4462643.1 type II toxin-antitoxin system RelE/ParE family toxin [Bacillota bacterium]MCL5994095.1 type II toxin-antitoxin system RelE/ParE family toxin [Bacillota bacterium]
MEQYKVIILAKAQEDMDEIVDYLNTLSPQAALRYYDLLVKKINSLSEMPKRCPLARDTQLRLRGYHYLVVESYIVFFVIIGDLVQIRRILFGRQQYESLL